MTFKGNPIKLKKNRVETNKCLIFNKCVNFTYGGKWAFIEELVNFLGGKVSAF